MDHIAYVLEDEGTNLLIIGVLIRAVLIPALAATDIYGWLIASDQHTAKCREHYFTTLATVNQTGKYMDRDCQVKCVN